MTPLTIEEVVRSAATDVQVNEVMDKDMNEEIELLVTDEGVIPFASI